MMKLTLLLPLCLQVVLSASATQGNVGGAEELPNTSGGAPEPASESVHWLQRVTKPDGDALLQERLICHAAWFHGQQAARQHPSGLAMGAPASRLSLLARRSSVL